MRLKSITKWLSKSATLFIIGGLLYMCIEMLWRGVTHWTMGIVGGLAFVIVGEINEDFTFEMPLIQQMFISSILITTIEFISGVILNLALRLNIWDYSNMPINIIGQVCLPYTFLWFLLSLPAIGLDDYLRYWLFGEEKPHYIWL